MQLKKHVAGIGLALTAASGVAVLVPSAADATPRPKPHPPTVTPLNEPCGSAGANYDRDTGHVKETGVNMRTGSSIGCTGVGQAQPGQVLDYYCFTWGNDGYSWSYVVNTATGKRGWIRDDLLDDGGSTYGCDF